MSATWDTKDLKATPVADDEVLIIDTGDSRNQKRATLSTLTTTTNISDFSASTDYLTGDIVLEDGITFRAITDITAGAFVQTDWRVSDGLGVKNTIQVYTENDFGFPLVFSRHELAQETEYIICAPITLTNGLSLPQTAIVTFRSFSKELNKIEWEGSGNIIIAHSKSISGSYDSVSFSGGTLQFVTGNTDNIVIGDRVNIEGTLYSLTNQEVTGVTDDTFFEITGTNEGSESGDFNNNAVKIEMQDIEIEGDGTNNGPTLFFTTAGSSEWFANHCDFEKLDVPLITNGPMLSITHLCEFEECGQASYGGLSQNIIHTANSYVDPEVGLGANVAFSANPNPPSAIIANNSFQSASGAVGAIRIDGSTVSGSSFIVIANTDKRTTATTLFDPVGLDETSIFVNAMSNGRQKDSLITAGARLASGSLVTVPTADTSDLAFVDSDLWTFNNEERISHTIGPVDGTITFDGLESTLVKVNYSCTIRPDGIGGKTLFGGFVLNTTSDIVESLFFTPVLAQNEEFVFSTSFFVILDSGDDLFFGVGNSTDTTSITVDQVNWTLEKAG